MVDLLLPHEIGPYLIPLGSLTTSATLARNLACRIYQQLFPALYKHELLALFYMKAFRLFVVSYLNDLKQRFRAAV
jgi:hypothetical protein